MIVKYGHFPTRCQYDRFYWKENPQANIRTSSGQRDKDHRNQRGNCKVHDAVAMSTLLSLKGLLRAGLVAGTDDTRKC